MSKREFVLFFSFLFVISLAIRHGYSESCHYCTCCQCVQMESGSDKRPNNNSCVVNEARLESNNCQENRNIDNYCSLNRSDDDPSKNVWALVIDRLSINAGPGTSRYFDELGTYRVEGQYVQVFARCWDTDNSIWWIMCEIPNSDHTIGWTGLKRFDQSTFDLELLPEIFYNRKTRTFQ